MTPLSLAVLTVATVETFSGPIPYERFAWSPPIYRSLEAIQGPGALVELPIYRGDRAPDNAPYMLASTTHWRPLVNGFSGFRPSHFDQMAQLVGTFPSPLALARLRDLDVRYVMVHTAAYRRPDPIREALQRVDERRNLVLVAQEGADRLYRIDPPRPNGLDGLLAGLEWPDRVTVGWYFGELSLLDRYNSVVTVKAVGVLTVRSRTTERILRLDAARRYTVVARRENVTGSLLPGNVRGALAVLYCRPVGA